MKILVITNYYKPAFVYGGPIRSVSALYEALSQLGSQVTVFTTNANGKKRLDVPLKRSVNVDGVEVFYFPLRAESTPMGRFYFSPELGKACRGQIRDFDIVVLQDIWTYPMWSAAKHCRRYGIPYVVTPRGVLMLRALQRGQWKKRAYIRSFARPLLNRAAAIQYTSPTEMAESMDSKVPTFIIPNSVRLSTYATMPPSGKMRSKLNIQDDAKVLLMLGRIHPVKSPYISVHALAAAQSLPQEVHLVIAGPDESNLKPALEKLAKDLGCFEKLHFTDLLEDDEVKECLIDADLLLMPSESENYGMSAAEALAAGLPILVSDRVPVGIWAEKGEAGRIVPHSPTAFAQATCELLADPEQLSAMARRGPDVVKLYFDNSTVAKQMLTEYQKYVR